MARPPKYSPETIAQAFENNHGSIRAMAKELKVSYQTIYRYLRTSQTEPQKPRPSETLAIFRNFRAPHTIESYAESLRIPRAKLNYELKKAINWLWCPPPGQRRHPLDYIPAELLAVIPRRSHIKAINLILDDSREWPMDRPKLVSDHAQVNPSHWADYIAECFETYEASQTKPKEPTNAEPTNRTE